MQRLLPKQYSTLIWIHALLRTSGHINPRTLLTSQTRSFRTNCHHSTFQTNKLFAICLWFERQNFDLLRRVFHTSHQIILADENSATTFEQQYMQNETRRKKSFLSPLLVFNQLMASTMPQWHIFLCSTAAGDDVNVSLILYFIIIFCKTKFPICKTRVKRAEKCGIVFRSGGSICWGVRLSAKALTDLRVCVA